MDMPSDPVMRTEYEQFTKLYEVRHAELRLEVKEGETELKSQLNTMNSKLDTLAAQMAAKSVDAWKLVATSSISLIGGYILSYLQHMFIK